VSLLDSRSKTATLFFHSFAISYVPDCANVSESIPGSILPERCVEQTVPDGPVGASNAPIEIDQADFLFHFLLKQDTVTGLVPQVMETASQ
jgi:hypothetical protein